ncbi:MAG: transposase, partial [Trebonia sp.]
VNRLSRRGNRRVNHAIHMAAVTQVRQKHSEGRAYYDKKLTEGKTHREALRSLKRQVSDAVFTRLRADARRAADHAESPGGQAGNDSATQRGPARTPDAGSSGKPLPGPLTTLTAALTADPVPASAGMAAPSSTAAIPPPAKPQVQVERPQRSEDERPGGTARRRPHSGARKPQKKADPAT